MGQTPNVARRERSNVGQCSAAPSKDGGEWMDLGNGAAEGVRLLYGFCRHVDDLADELPIDESRVALAGGRRELGLLLGRGAGPSVKGVKGVCGFP